MGDLRGAGDLAVDPKSGRNGAFDGHSAAAKCGRNSGAKLNEIAKKRLRKQCQNFAASLWRMITATRRDSGDIQSVRLLLSALLVLASVPAYADYRITRDFGGLVEQYKAKYAQIRDRGERVIIDGICNSACTLVLGIVPLNKICVTPQARASASTPPITTRPIPFGIKVTSYAGTADLMSYYPPTVKDWIERKGGLTPEMKRVQERPRAVGDDRPLPGRVLAS